MATIDVFNADEFSLTNLTETVNKAPFVETHLAQLFETAAVATETVFIERGESGLEIIETSAKGQVSPASSLGLNRQARPVASVKLGRLVGLTPAEIQNTRAFGTESDLETMQMALDQKVNPVLRSMDATHEALRLGAVKGVQFDKDGTTVLNDFYNLFGIVKPSALDLGLDVASPAAGAVRGKFRTATRFIRDALGDITSNGTMLIAGKDMFDAIIDHPEVRDAYNRWMDGAWLREDSLSKPFTYEGVSIIEYRGAGLAANEGQFIPMGVPGMFKTVFTPGDHIEVANTLGRPRYAFPNLMDFGKGFQVELVSCPIHFCTRPEALLGATI